jgi:uncharacterized cupin superfamily protein
LRRAVRQDEQMRRVNLSEPELTYDPADPDGFRAGMFRFGPSLGAAESGASVYELPPGQAVCPYHYEHGEEEWLLVLDGEPSVRTPEGTEVLRPFDVVFFPKGPDGAHQVRNDGEAPARVLMWSTVAYPTVSVYPDSDKIGVWTRDRTDNVMVERSSGVDYYHGERG